ncbi:flavonol 4'-sulfotransferase-like [Solanum dulcamara]|uniref:flavonol 4'-sulfotransferase-like n=1 Tax=Solanum dulcamara TaxID=45834 RepID=UPI0024868F13|nr:flavonol 4'-sulfotransferase-like [Solanum dulcamara]
MVNTKKMMKMICSHSFPKKKAGELSIFTNINFFWFTLGALKGVKSTQQCFKAEPTDIFLTSPKSGTTWFKALIFTIMNRDRFDFSSHPLLTKGHHDNLPFLEAIIRNEASYNDYRISSSPHCLFATHIPYSLLAISVMSFGCKIVYVFREAKDVFVSNWHYMKNLRPKDLPSFPIEDAFDLFCKGVSHYGPFWNHELGYWNASLENPDKVLFLNYEDMKKDPVVCVTKLAKFLDKPFCLEEEREEVGQKIVRLCSFENLSSWK